LQPSSFTQACLLRRSEKIKKVTTLNFLKTLPIKDSYSGADETSKAEANRDVFEVKLKGDLSWLL
jgi:hypothetical protein